MGSMIDETTYAAVNLGGATDSTSTAPRRIKWAGSWHVGPNRRLGVRSEVRPNAFQRWVARVVLGFEWRDSK